MHLPSQSTSTNNRKSQTNSWAQAIDEQLSVEDWPIEPRKLRNNTTLALFLNLCEALITFAPIAFISMFKLRV